VTTITRRIRNIGRVVGQGEGKTPTAPWVKALPWNSSDKSSASSSLTEYFFGWNKEMLRATRTVAAGGKKELSLPLEVDADLQDIDLVTATWADGCTHEIPQITQKMLKELMKAGGSKTSAGVLWEDEHTASHNKLYMAQRVDRCLFSACTSKTNRSSRSA
jgi:hypothetical protein